MYSREIEDYLKYIHFLSKEKGYARTTELAQKIDVSLPSISQMVKKLREQKLLLHKKYGVIKLTEKGKRIAKELELRNKIFVDFLKKIGVPKETAERDACELEHNLSTETLARLMIFVRRMK